VGWVHRGIGTSGPCVGTTNGRFVHLGIDTSGPVVATLDGEKWLHRGIGTYGPVVATIDGGKYVHQGLGTSELCIGTIDGKYVHRGVGTSELCIGTINSANWLERLAGGAALLVGLLEMGGKFDEGASAHRANAQAHFQAGRFNEGMTELVRAIRWYETNQEWDGVAKVREEMAEHNLLTGLMDRGRFNAAHDLKSAAGAWVEHGQELAKQRRIEEACESYKKALDDADRSVKIDPSFGGDLSLKITRSKAEKGIADLKST
jgi:tetratricopeptide (TPR) repeat protein